VKTRPGTYGGRSLEQRQADRRRQLVEAALEIWREHGWSAVTMRGVCTRARLTDRYFYEHFSDRDALLVAVWDQVRDTTIARVLDAIASRLDQDPISQLRGAIAELVHNLGDDPRGAQLLFGEHTGSAALEQCRQQTLQQFTDLLVALAGPHLRDGADAEELRMSALMGIGGFVELVTAWQAGIIDTDAERVIEHSARVGALLAAQYLRQEGSSTTTGMVRSVLDS
jgi:AcrR family transcriptional regulator